MSWSNDGSYLAIGNDAGDVEVWDVDEGKRMRVMSGHNARVPSLSWHGHVLSSGCRDGSIHHHDVRVARHKVMELMGHTAEVSLGVVHRAQLISGMWLEVEIRWAAAGEWR
jgi:cell division cycle protein 20 (cofactor of APC complex)